MSTFRHPVGPQPTRVYWVRRLAALLLLLLVIGLVAFGLSRIGGDPDPAPIPAPSDSAAVAATPTPSPTAELVEGAACLPENVRVDAVTDDITYQADVSPQLSFTITNTAGVACTFDVGSSQQSFVVTSGAETYWSSRDCLVDPTDASIVLEPNLGQTSAALGWDRTRSAPDTCASERPAVPGGGATYALTVTVGPVSSAPTSFRLF
jgi:hypothetical protein